MKVGEKIKNYANFLLFLYSALIFVDLVFELGFPLVGILLFFVFVPGYSITEYLLPGTHALEKAAASVGMSLGLFLGLRGFAEASRTQETLPELAIVSIITLVLLTVILVRE